jgi:hypothetical protein
MAIHIKANGKLCADALTGNIKIHSDNCCAHDCPDFCTDGWPTSWTVVIDGYTDRDCGGGENCRDLDGTYVVNDSYSTDSSECRTAETIDLVCNYNNVFVYINKPGSDYILNVDMGGAPTLEIWRNNLGTTKPDCRTFDGVVCTLVTYTGSCSLASGSTTATVTAYE